MVSKTATPSPLPRLHTPHTPHTPPHPPTSPNPHSLGGAGAPSSPPPHLSIPTYVQNQPKFCPKVHL
ncbi:hypothetical protein CEN44_13995 [Fischerella muscicola CCMEE 5323]|uniref:Uncharacterized protein n=1 Tax=Fischerella muscicola CCMEE 5323 TaxID=2019572 RepID=A0A2N6K240_FISMU|nr:hypothetical protein CEN44_13995 [Fischerella muscicola CCMEE 5323]